MIQIKTVEVALSKLPRVFDILNFRRDARVGNNFGEAAFHIGCAWGDADARRKARIRLGRMNKPPGVRMREGEH